MCTTKRTEAHGALPQAACSSARPERMRDAPRTSTDAKAADLSGTVSTTSDDASWNRNSPVSGMAAYERMHRVQCRETAAG